MDKGSYKVIKCEVLNVIADTPLIKTIVLKPGTPFSFKTGQFVELSIAGYGEAPFTPSSNPAKTDTIDITIMKAGRFTSKVHELKKGDNVGIRGPLGLGYPLEELKGRDILVLGGGVGMAPLRSFLYALLNERDKYKRIVLCYGAKTPEDVVYKELLNTWKQGKELEVFQSVDKVCGTEWKDCVGVVTVLLEKLEIDYQNVKAVVCGPPIMMKFGTLKLLSLKVPENSIYLSMEKNMSCGFGKCGHCQLGKYYVCKDGPVFKYSGIKHIDEIWD